MTILYYDMIYYNIIQHVDRSRQRQRQSPPASGDYLFCPPRLTEAGWEGGTGRESDGEGEGGGERRRRGGGWEGESERGGAGESGKRELVKDGNMEKRRGRARERESERARERERERERERVREEESGREREREGERWGEMGQALEQSLPSSTRWWGPSSCTWRATTSRYCASIHIIIIIIIIIIGFVFKRQHRLSNMIGGPPFALERPTPCAEVYDRGGSETGGWLLTEDHSVRDIMCCAIYAGDIEVSAASSNWEPGFQEPSLPAS